MYFSCRKMRFSGWGTWQEIAGNCRRVSGLKNQEGWPAFTRIFCRSGRAPKYRTKGCSRYWRPKFAARNGSNATKTSVRAPGLSPDEREQPFVWYFGAGWRSIKMQMEAVSRYKLVLWKRFLAKTKVYSCKGIAIETGGVSRCFSRASGSRVDVPLFLKVAIARPIQFPKA